MGVVGIWSLDPEQVITPVDENGQPTGTPPVPVVTGYQDEETGSGVASWEAAQQFLPNYVEPVAEGGSLEAFAGLPEPPQEAVEEPVDQTPVDIVPDQVEPDGVPAEDAIQ